MKLIMYTCCFIGHRDATPNPELITAVRASARALITIFDTDTFLFGSASGFDRICLSVVTDLKEEYPHIRRVYVRAEFPDIDDFYREKLLGKYDDTVFPEELRSAGRARYVERNRIMIDWADSCVFYYRGESTVADRSGRKRKSGTALAWDYAVKRKKDIYNVSEIMCPENFLK